MLHCEEVIYVYIFLQNDVKKKKKKNVGPGLVNVMYFRKGEKNLANTLHHTPYPSDFSLQLV